MTEELRLVEALDVRGSSLWGWGSRKMPRTEVLNCLSPKPEPLNCSPPRSGPELS